MIFDLFLDKGNENKKKKGRKQKAPTNINRSEDAIANNSTNETSQETRKRRVSKSPRNRARRYDPGMLSSDHGSKRSLTKEKVRKPEELRPKKPRKLDTSTSSSVKKRKLDPNFLDITFEEDAPELSFSSSDEESGQPREGCFQCNPQTSEYDEDSIHIENLRKKCKQEIKKTKNKKEKMKLDEELRMSYQQNIHTFQNLVKTNARKNEVRVSMVLCKKCEHQNKIRQIQASKKKTYLQIDKRQMIYDESEIDHINGHQSKIYISYVDTNSYIKYGIRTHYKELTIAHCLHSTFNIFHRDFVLIWIHFLPGLYMLWQVIAMQLGISHFYNYSIMMLVANALLSAWFFAKAFYYMFYAMSYRIECELNKWIKVANMFIVFPYAIFMSYSLFNHFDAKQYELGYLTIFIMSTLFVLNVVLTLNPIYRDHGSEKYQRSCCSGQNLMMTISFIFCFKVMELHHFLVATDQQKQVFYKPMHQILAVWLIGLWINMHYLPERIFTNSKFIHKYLSSDIIKGLIAVITIFTVNILLRDAIKLAEADRAKYLQPTTVPIAVQPPVNMHLHKLLSKYGQAPAPIQVQVQPEPQENKNSQINQQLEDSKKQLAEAEAQLQSLKADLKKQKSSPKIMKPSLTKLAPLYNPETLSKLAAEHPVIAELTKEIKPEEEALPPPGSAAADSPYNQPGASTQMVAEEAKRSWAQELYLYLVQ